MKVKLTESWRFWPRGTVFENCTQDALNFYAHGVVDDYFPGITSNYLCIPRYAGLEM